MRARVFPITLLGTMFGLVFSIVSAQENADIEIMEYNYSCPDVIKAFDALTNQGEWLGYHMNDSFGLDFTDNESRHIQGVARSQRTGAPPVFYVTHSTDTDSNIEYPGIMVVELGSRPTNGERLRSNRLKPGAETTNSEPPQDDYLINSIKDTKSHHPSGISMVGEILAVPSAGKIFFYNGRDLQTEETPKPVYTMTINKGKPDCPSDPTDEEKKECHGAQGVGTTRTPAGRFLLVTNDNYGAHFHWSNSSENLIGKSGTPSQISVSKPEECPAECTIDCNECLDDEECKKECDKECEKQRCASCPDEFCVEFFNEFFEGYQPVPRDEIKDEAGNQGYWPIKGVGHSTKALQGVNLVDQIDENGNYRLFLIGSTNSQEWSNQIPGNDELYLMEVVQKGVDEAGNPIDVEIDLSKLTDGEELELVGIRKEIDKSLANPGSWDTFWDYARRKNGNFNAGGCTYVSPSGELLYYGVSHWNNGPGDSVKLAELRHNHVVRDGSQTYSIIANPGGPYVVNEGDSVQLNGSLSHAPTAAPWLHLFEDIDFSGVSVMVDYEDLTLDDYDDFSQLDEQPWFCSDDLCLDPELASELTTAMNSFSENELAEFLNTFKNMDDLFPDQCYGVWHEGECYTVPPVLDEDDCRDACEKVSKAARVACRGGLPSCYGLETCEFCVGVAEDIRDDICYPGCEAGADGIPGLVAPYPDFEGIIQRLSNLTSNIEPFLNATIGVVESMADNVAGIDPDSRILDKLDRWPSLIPPFPTFDFMAPDYWAYDITDLGNVDADGFVEDFENRFTSAIDEVSDYGKLYIAAWKDFLLSLEGFNDQASALRWYAPVGMDFFLYSKADYGGLSMTLPGNGSVQSVAFTGGMESWNDRVRSIEFVGAFESLALDNYLWSIVSTSSPGSYSLLDDTEVTPTFDATDGDGPSGAEIELEVQDSAGQLAQATAIVQVLNVAPQVQIDRIEDQTTGTSIDDFVPPVLLEAVEYVLYGSFTDAGIHDTQTAGIDWGDGSTNTSDEDIMQLSDSQGGLTGTVDVTHVYGVKGAYPITLAVTDEDGDSGQAVRNVQVLDALEATQLGIEHIKSMLADPLLDRKAAKSLRKALSKLQGNRDGAAKNGALHFLNIGKLNTALVRINQAMIYLADAVEADLSLTDEVGFVQRLMTTAAKSVATKAMKKAETMARSKNDRRKITDAYALLSEGDNFQIAEDFVGAAQSYYEAYKAVQGII